MRGGLNLKSDGLADRGKSSWSFREAIIIRLWHILWCLLLRWTPKKLNFLRLLALRLFGAKVHGRPFVFPSAEIYAPFNLELYHRVCIGPKVQVYNLGKVILKEGCVVSQETMLCGGTHDLTTPRLPLIVGEIVLEKEVFIGARAMIMPSIRLGEGAVVGAGAVVTKDVESWAVVGGNPAKFIKKRELKD